MRLELIDWLGWLTAARSRRWSRITTSNLGTITKALSGWFMASLRSRTSFRQSRYPIYKHLHVLGEFNTWVRYCSTSANDNMLLALSTTSTSSLQRRATAPVKWLEWCCNISRFLMSIEELWLEKSRPWWNSSTISAPAETRRSGKAYTTLTIPTPIAILTA